MSYVGVTRVASKSLLFALSAAGAEFLAPFLSSPEVPGPLSLPKGAHGWRPGYGEKPGGAIVPAVTVPYSCT